MSNATSRPIAMSTTTFSQITILVLDEEDEGFNFSDLTIRILTVMNFAVIMQIVSIFGTISNIINITIFVKMGFKDPVNITLFGLAISDLGSCSTLIWMSICFNPSFQRLDLPLVPEEVQYLQAGWPHNTFARITMCITAMITFERCLCVVVPLKVKGIITRKRVTICLILIYISMFALSSPVYYYTRHIWRFDHSRNKSILGIFFTDDRNVMEPIVFTVNSVALPIFVFIVIVIFTSILAVSLKRKTEWREAATNTTSKNNATSSRDAKLSKMVVVISVVFIICFIPVFVSLGAMAIVPEFSVLGRYRYLNFVIFSYHFLLDSSNSAFNIFIYYKMSTNYRERFDKHFRRNNNKSVQGSS